MSTWDVCRSIEKVCSDLTISERMQNTNTKNWVHRSFNDCIFLGACSRAQRDYLHLKALATTLVTSESEEKELRQHLKDDQQLSGGRTVFQTYSSSQSRRPRRHAAWMGPADVCMLFFWDSKEFENPGFSDNRSVLSDVHTDTSTDLN